MDPIGWQTLEWNLHCYVENSPTQAVDPSGRNPIKWFLKAVWKLVSDDKLTNTAGGPGDTVQQCTCWFRYICKLNIYKRVGERLVWVDGGNFLGDPDNPLSLPDVDDPPPKHWPITIDEPVPSREACLQGARDLGMPTLFKTVFDWEGKVPVYEPGEELPIRKTLKILIECRYEYLD